MFKVSIIIPAYNTADVIHRTLTSVENQTYKNHQIVIINDGSTDGTKELLDEYKQNKDNVIVYHQENQGVSVARNKGIELATGEFICFLDSDDTYDPEFLEEMLKRQQETNAEAVYCGFKQITESGKIDKHPASFCNGNILNSYYMDDGFIHFSGMIVRKDFLINNNINFEPGRKISEDVLFTVKIFNLTEVYAVEKYMLNYFYRENSAINSEWDDEKWLSDLNSHRNALNYLIQHYHQNNKTELINTVKFKLLNREITFLYYKLLKCQLSDIRSYISGGDFLDAALLNNDRLKRGERKKVSYLTSKSQLKQLMGYLYYRFIRINLKKNKQ